RIQTVRSEHFGTGVFQRSGALNGLIRGQVANNSRDRSDKRIGLYAGVDEKAAEKQRTLFKAMVDGDGGLRNDMHIVNVGDDANDALQFRRALAIDLQDRIGPEHVAIDRVLIREHAFREGLANDGDGLFAMEIELIEIATRNDGNAQRPKEPGRDDTILRARILFTGGVIVTIRAKLQGGTRAGITPGSDHPEGGLIDTWKRVNTAYDFLVKIDNLLARLSVKHGGNIDGKDMARVHTGLRPLQCKECSHHHTCAGQQHKRCADLCYDEDTLASLAAG